MWTLLLVQFMRSSEEFELRYSSSRMGGEWILERTAERSFAQHKSLLINTVGVEVSHSGSHWNV